MGRSGLNCTLSYTDGKNRRAYRVRVDRVVFGFEMIAEESQARTRRAFYPHQTAPSQFGIGVVINGNAERNSFNGWMMAYANYILDPGLKGKMLPQMTVSVPMRGFTRVGVPVRGFEFGDHLGSMVWTPLVIFETSGEPKDWDQTFYTSKVYADLARANSPATQYFYPTGTQLSGGEAPTQTGYQAVQAVLGGGAAPTSQQSKVDRQLGDVTG